VKLKLLVGQYAHKAFLGPKAKKTLTETVKAWREYHPENFPLPHPSPLNNIWLSRNPWFDERLIPALRRTIRKLGINP
jgi:uracil-DNA glycosylase